MTRVLCASSVTVAGLYAAALDAGRIGSGRRVLVVANEADTPEVVADPSSAPGFAAIAARFDEVVSWNALIAPLHPSAWRPPQHEIPVLARLLTARLAASEPIEELVVESVVAGPGRTLAVLVPDPPITVAAGGLDAYAPPLFEPTTEAVERTGRLLYADRVPELRPLLRYREDTTAEPVPLSMLRDVFAPSTVPVPLAALDAVVLGERWAERGVLGADEEQQLRIDAVSALAAAGHVEILFAPHPAAGPVDRTPLVEAARDVGVRLAIGPAGIPHEVWTAGAHDALIVSIGAPELFAAPRRATSGCRTVLDRLGRYDHVDRVPLVIADAALPRLSADGSITAPADIDLPHLIDSVAFCLAPTVVPRLRQRAADYAVQYGTAPYLRRRRLEEFGIVFPPREPPSGLRSRLAKVKRGALRRGDRTP